VVFSSPVTARYLRIVADEPDNGGQTGGQMSISEVGAYAPSAGQADVALDKPAQALFLDGTQAQMQPGSLPSMRTTATPPRPRQATNQYRWIQQIDLQKPQSLDLITLLQPDSAYATAFHIDVSLDGSKFWTVARTTDAAAGSPESSSNSPGHRHATSASSPTARTAAGRPAGRWPSASWRPTTSSDRSDPSHRSVLNSAARARPGLPCYVGRSDQTGSRSGNVDY
jgi:hypothetical protein